MTRALNAAVILAAIAAVGAFAAATFSAAQAQTGNAAVTQARAANPLTGEQLFQAKCAMCHEAGGWGTRALARRAPADQAQLKQRDNLPAVYVEMVVRQGVGSMPQFTPTDLTDAELKRLAQWLEGKK